MGRWLVLLFLIGAALIGLGLTNYIPEDMGLYVIGGGGVLILLVIFSWWFSRRKRKMAYAPAGRRRPAPGSDKVRYELGNKAITDEAIARRTADLAEEKKRRPLTSKEIKKLRKAA